MFPAYGAQTVHMPFGSVYTSLQRAGGFAENASNFTMPQAYEVAPVLSIIEHEAKQQAWCWISDKLWSSLSAEQKQWVRAAADEVNRVQPDKAFELEHQSETRLKAIGVKVVTDFDKSGFSRSRALSRFAVEAACPHASKIRQMIGAINSYCTPFCCRGSNESASMS